MIQLTNTESLYAVCNTGGSINLILNGILKISNVISSFSAVNLIPSVVGVVYPNNISATYVNIATIKLINLTSLPVTGIKIFKGVGSPTTQLTESLTVQGDSSLSISGLGTSITGADSIKYITNVDVSIPNFTYIGKAALNSIDSDPVWQIQLIDESASITTIKYADGTKDFINIWDDRLSYTYS